MPRCVLTERCLPSGVQMTDAEDEVSRITTLPLSSLTRIVVAYREAIERVKGSGERAGERGP